MARTLTILGLESSCDDTAAAIVTGGPDEIAEINGFRQRLARGNPYQLDAAGRLYLQGVSPMTQVLVSNSDWQCRLNIDVQPGIKGDGIPNLGVFVCVKEIYTQPLDKVDKAE